MLAPALHLQEKTLPSKEIYKKDEALLKELDPEIRTAFETLFTKQDKETLKIFLEEIQPGRSIADKDFLTSNWREKGYFFSEKPLYNVKELLNLALIITGRNDSICGYKDHLYLINKFPNSTFVVLEKAGHMLHIEKRRIVQDLVKDWLLQ